MDTILLRTCTCWIRCIWSKLVCVYLAGLLLMSAIAGRGHNGAPPAPEKAMVEFHGDEMDCPHSGAKFLGENYSGVMWGTPDRALRTLPQELYIAASHIKGAGLGVFSDTFIHRYTWLGEYEGEILSKDMEDEISWYAWSIHRDLELMYYVDGGNVETSSYLRFINTPLRSSDENVQVMECKGRVYYMINKDVRPGEELLVFYGDEYLEALGINMTKYYNT